MSDIFLETHNEEITRLAFRFRSYGTGIDRSDVRRWLNQFDNEHKMAGLKLLRLVDFYDPPKIIRNFQTAHQQFLATCSLSSIDEVTFFPFGRVGKSASSMSYLYGIANDVHVSKFQNYSNLTAFFEEGASERPILTFIDDFIGTGTQALDTFERLREIPIPRDSTRVLIVLVGFSDAISDIREKTDLIPICPRLLTDEDRLFSNENEGLDDADIEILRTYCDRLGKWPTGYGNCQSPIVFYYKSSNNVPSILRCFGENWIPLFPRRLPPV